MGKAGKTSTTTQATSPSKSASKGWRVCSRGHRYEAKVGKTGCPICWKGNRAD